MLNSAISPCLRGQDHVTLQIITSRIISRMRKGTFGNIVINATGCGCAGGNSVPVPYMEWQRIWSRPKAHGDTALIFLSYTVQIHYIHNVRGPSYLVLTRPMSWLLLPWLLALPGHQQPWYWVCEIDKSWSYTRTDFNNLWYVNVEEWHK